MFYDGYEYDGRSFEQTYRCYPPSFIDKPQIENGDKIIMPLSALHRLASLNINYPMLFQLRNNSTGRVSHCGVLEFIAEEGIIYMPYWMMQNLCLQEGDIVTMKNVSLPKGKYVKLQPHTNDFLDVSNPKAVLETTLRNFSCLTKGDSIMVSYNDKKYYIDIVETKPCNGISIIETDCEVDFAAPLDYKEPETTAPSNSRLDGKYNGDKKSVDAPSSEKSSSHSQGKLVFGSNTNRAPEKQKEAVKEEPKFQAFSGKKYTLRG